MAHPNEDLLRQSYEVDMESFGKMLADDIVLHVPGRSPIAGDYRGRSEVLGFQCKLFELSGGTIQVDLHDALANDEHGAALQVTRAERGGKRLEARQTFISHLRESKFQEVWLQSEDQYGV